MGSRVPGHGQETGLGEPTAMEWEGSQGGWELYASSAEAGKCLLKSCLGWVLFRLGHRESVLWVGDSG